MQRIQFASPKTLTSKTGARYTLKDCRISSMLHQCQAASISLPYSDQAIEILCQYYQPGNTRQIEALVKCKSDIRLMFELLALAQYLEAGSLLQVLMRELFYLIASTPLEQLLPAGFKPNYEQYIQLLQYVS